MLQEILDRLFESAQVDLRIGKYKPGSDNEGEWEIRAYDGDNVVAAAWVVITGTDIRGYTIGQVVNVWVDDEYKRRGIATKMYRRIEQEGVLLEPHESQSPESRAMWQRMKWRDRVDEISPSELRDIRKGQYTPISIAKKLEKLGYKFKGRGTYSDIYVNPDSQVIIKVGRGKDPCWEAFANIVKGPGKGNPWFPRIAGLQTIQSRHGTYFIAFMEKLNNLSKDNIRFVNWVDKHFDKLQRGQTNIDLYYDALHDDLFPPYVNEKIDKKFVEALELLNEHMPDGCSNDLHEDNFMERDNGQIVIIDPFWDGSA